MQENILASNLDGSYKPYLKKGTDSSTGQNVGMLTRVDPIVSLYRTELRYDYPIQLIQNIYKDFQKNLSYLKNDASQKFHMKKRMMMDSMDISQF